MTMTKVKVGLVGLGEVAQVTHLPILQEQADKFEIAAICDISHELLTVLGERYNVPAEHRYLDYMALARQEDLDAVLVVNSDEYHTDSALAAIRHGKHVLIEKPMCLTRQDADKIIKARDEAGVKVMVGYMRRYAPAFIQAVEQVHALEKINYVRVRDIIGQNAQVVSQSSVVIHTNDIPQSHDLSAMREMFGMPERVVAARQHGRFLTVLFEYDGFTATYEVGVDHNRRFDAHITVYGDSKEIRVQYNTPYIRHLPTQLFISETQGDSFEERVIRPTFTDSYTLELQHFYEVITNNAQPKTTAEDFLHDLDLFAMIISALAHDASSVL